MPYFSHDTIAQIGTPPGKGCIGVIRISGPDCRDILRQTTQGLEEILASTLKRTTRHCRFLLSLREAGNPGTGRRRYSCGARAFLMPGPASYTREDVAEIHLPGSPPLLKAAMMTVTAAGARAAAPGEFTFRAFRNGRLTLRQAEAVEEVICAGTEAERRRALSHLGDAGQIHALAWRERFMGMAARVEAVLDFAEGDLDADIVGELGEIAEELTDAASGIAAANRDMDAGLPHIALVGQANAGKSSLLNALLQEEAALVSGLPSTTRDSLRREIVWDGVRFVLSDNPGFDPDARGSGGRAADRAFAALGGEDVTCWVVDASRPLQKKDRDFAAGLSGTIIVTLNKSDLPPRVYAADILEIAAVSGFAVGRCLETSASAGTGLAALRACLAKTAANHGACGHWNRREASELATAAECCRRAAKELNGAGRLELVADDLRRGAAAFSRAQGEGYAEEALMRIFRGFCIGK